MAATALLIIDVQNELFRKKTPVYRADEMLANICTLAECARQAGAPAIYVQHENNTMSKDSDGWQLHPHLRPHEGDLFFHKQQSSALKVNALQDALASLGIRQLVITGLVTHGCVKAACLDGIKLGYQVTLVSDGHSNFNANPVECIGETHEKLRQAGVSLKTTAEVTFAS
ncbi:MAG: cysteine hydrolase family protein [Chloroflexota bacterium]